MQKLIEIKNIFKIYNTGYAKVYALSDVSLNINRGDFTAIIGKSGSGKSTFLAVLMFQQVENIFSMGRKFLN